MTSDELSINGSTPTTEVVATRHHYAYIPVQVDLANGPTAEVRLPVGARVVHVGLSVVADRIVLARPNQQQPTTRVAPLLVIQVDPRVTETTLRRFILLTAGQAIASNEELQLVGVVTTPDGSMIAVLEEPL